MYEPKCPTCRNYFKMKVKMMDNTRLDRRIECLINNNAFEGLKIGHYRDENERDHEDPNVVLCSHYEKL